MQYRPGIRFSELVDHGFGPRQEADNCVQPRSEASCQRVLTVIAEAVAHVVDEQERQSVHCETLHREIGAVVPRDRRTRRIQIFTAFR